MTTGLDIVDTAVKIGLGAVITAVATYIISHRNYKDEIRKNLVRDKKALLIEITRKVDKSNELKNNALHAIWLKANNGVANVDINEELRMLWAASNELKTASSSCFLIGQPELSGPLSELHDGLSELHGHFAQHETSYDKEFIEAITAQRKDTHRRLNNLYAKAFESIHRV